MMRIELVAAALSLSCAAAKSTPDGAEQFRFVDGPAGKLHLSDGGSGGTPVVFVHGLTGDLETWRPQLDHLRRSRRAIAIELRGHGLSSPPADGNWSMEGLADDIDAATRELPPFVLVGHSLAGVPLQLYAARHPERLKGLVFADAVGSFAAFGKEAVEKLIADDARNLGTDPVKQRAVIEALFGATARPATRAQVLAAFPRLPPEGFLALRRNLFRFVPSSDLPSSGIPLFSIEVAREKPVPIFFSALAPDAPRKTIAGVSHWLMLDDPQAFNALLDEFLRSLQSEAR